MSKSMFVFLVPVSVQPEERKIVSLHGSRCGPYLYHKTKLIPKPSKKYISFT